MKKVIKEHRTVGKTTHARDIYIYNTCLKIKLPKRKSVECVLDEQCEEDVALKRPGYGVPGDNA
jgi:hypothetical protein